MPNFLNSFKIDDFVDRKNRKNKRLLSECEITELNQLKRGLLAFYIKDKKASYDAYEPVVEKLKTQQKELDKHQAELDKVRTKHLNEMKDAQKEAADIKAKNEAKRMEEEAKALGADAIVCARFATSSVMQNAAEVMAYGTAVKIR